MMETEEEREIEKEEGEGSALHVGWLNHGGQELGNA